MTRTGLPSDAVQDRLWQGRSPLALELYSGRRHPPRMSSMYLRLLLSDLGLDDVSWSGMPSLTSREGSLQQQLLAQWRRVTIAALIVAAVSLLVFAAFLVGRLAHAVNI